MLDSILFFLYALAYSIYVLFLSIGCIFIFMVLMAGVITIGCYIWPDKDGTDKDGNNKCKH